MKITGIVSNKRKEQTDSYLSIDCFDRHGHVLFEVSMVDRDTNFEIGQRVQIEIKLKPAKCGAEIFLPGEEG